MARGPLISDDKKVKMRDLENGGWTRSAIAKELGVSNSAVTRILGVKDGARNAVDAASAIAGDAVVQG